MRVLDALDLLLEQPNMGRLGEIAGTRELVVPETPYVAVYEVNGEHIDVLSIWHGRQDWRH